VILGGMEIELLISQAHSSLPVMQWPRSSLHWLDAFEDAGTPDTSALHSGQRRVHRRSDLPAGTMCCAWKVGQKVRFAAQPSNRTHISGWTAEMG
jgi:hypothetical protein